MSVLRVCWIDPLNEQPLKQNSGLFALHQVLQMENRKDGPDGIGKTHMHAGEQHVSVRLQPGLLLHQGRTGGRYQPKHDWPWLPEITLFRHFAPMTGNEPQAEAARSRGL